MRLARTGRFGKPANPGPVRVVLAARWQRNPRSHDHSRAERGGRNPKRFDRGNLAAGESPLDLHTAEALHDLLLRDLLRRPVGEASVDPPAHARVSGVVGQREILVVLEEPEAHEERGEDRLGQRDHPQHGIELPHPAHDPHQFGERQQAVGLDAAAEALEGIHGFAVPRHGTLDEETRRVISAFQMRYRPARFDGVPDAETAAILHVLVTPP